MPHSRVTMTSRLFLLLFALLSGAGYTSSAQTTISQNSGVVSYFYNDSYWSTVANTVPKGGFAIANPNSGPGTAVDSNWAKWIAETHKAGVRVIGYVDTGYFGTNNQNTNTPQRLTRLRQGDMQSWENQIEQDVDEFYNLYGQSGLDGIFFDDGQNICGSNNIIAQYYKQIFKYVKKNHPGSFVVLNPGTAVPQCFEHAADTLLDFEGYYDCYVGNSSACASEGGAPYAAETWTTIDPNKHYHIIYNMPAGDTTALAQVMQLSKSRNAGYVYAIDASGGNPYAGLPSYFSTEISELAGTYDNTIPSAPDTVDTVSVGERSAVLNWGPSTNGGTTGIVAYDVYEVVNGTPSSFVASVQAGSHPRVALPLLTPNTTYTFAVQARTGAGVVGPFSHVSFTTEVNDSDLLAPTNVTASPDYGDVQITWTAAKTNEYPVAHYDIAVTNLYTNIQATAPVLALTTDAAVTHATLSGLTPATSYTIQVTSRDTHGGVKSAAPLTVTTRSVPGGSAVGTPAVQYSAANGLSVAVVYYLPYTSHLVYLDADNSVGTGYATGPGGSTPQIGADYLLDDDGLRAFTGANAQTYSFATLLSGTTPVVTGTASTGWTYTWSYPLSTFTGSVSLGNTITVGAAGDSPLTWAPTYATATKQ